MRCSVLALTLLLMTGATASAQAQMKEYVSKDGRYRVLMPGTPGHENQTIRYKNGTSATQEMSSVDVGDEVTYAVMYHDIPPGATDGTPEQTMVNAVKAATRDRTLVWDKAISLNGVPGRSLKVISKSGSILEVRYYVSGQRFYQLVVGATPAKYNQLDLPTFFDSFKIIK
jgi:hypothetical protein